MYKVHLLYLLFGERSYHEKNNRPNYINNPPKLWPKKTGVFKKITHGQTKYCGFLCGRFRIWRPI